jgi:Salmonella virulence plasmid 65kDa B protein/FG-GAP-like repeat
MGMRILRMDDPMTVDLNTDGVLENKLAPILTGDDYRARFMPPSIVFQIVPGNGVSIEGQPVTLTAVTTAEFEGVTFRAILRDGSQRAPSSVSIVTANNDKTYVASFMGLPAGALTIQAETIKPVISRSFSHSVVAAAGAAACATGNWFTTNAFEGTVATGAEVSLTASVPVARTVSFFVSDGQRPGASQQATGNSTVEHVARWTTNAEGTYRIFATVAGNDCVAATASIELRAGPSVLLEVSPQSPTTRPQKVTVKATIPAIVARGRDGKDLKVLFRIRRPAGQAEDCKAVSNAEFGDGVCTIEQGQRDGVAEIEWSPQIDGNYTITASPRIGQTNLSSVSRPHQVATPPNLRLKVEPKVPGTTGAPLTVTATVTGLAQTGEVRFRLPSGMNEDKPLCNSEATARQCSVDYEIQSEGAFTFEATEVSTLERVAATYVASATPSPPDLNAEVFDGASTSTVGTTAGSFGVTDSGAATYNVPIIVAPGVAGMQPQLSLQYNSQGGNGHVGVGWSVAGLSAITRCPRTEATDALRAGVNYDRLDNDAYCLDGQRLLRVATAQTDTNGFVYDEYRTEVESYSRIRAYFNTLAANALGSVEWNDTVGLFGQTPARFEVVTKSGQIMHFGFRHWIINDGALQTRNESRINSIRVWPLDLIEDRTGDGIVKGQVVRQVEVNLGGVRTWINVVDGARYARGNFVEIDYCGIVGAPFRGAANRKGFKPSGQESASTSYCPELVESFETPNPLGIGPYPGVEFFPAKIRYGNNKGEVVGDVFLTYESRAGNEQSTSFDSGAGQYLSTRRLTKVETYTRTRFGGVPHADDRGQLVRRYQLAYVQQAISKRSLLTSIQECASATSCLSPLRFDWLPAAPVSFKADVAVEVGRNLGSDSNTSSPRIADFDGDGKSKIAQAFVENGQFGVRVCRGDGVGVGERCRQWSTQGVSGSLSNMRFAENTGNWFIGDFNGDGIIDVAFLYQTDVSAGVLVCYVSSDRSRFSACVNTDTSGGVISPVRVNDPQFQADLNGDGRIDFMFYEGNDAWRIYLSTGSGFIKLDSTLIERPQPPEKLPGDPDIEPGTDIQFQVMLGDFDGDGRADMLLRRTNKTPPGFSENNVPEQCLAALRPVAEGETPRESCEKRGGVLASPMEQWTICFSTLPVIPSQALGTSAGRRFVCGRSWSKGVRGSVNRVNVSDFNGDGLADIAAPIGVSVPASTTRKWRVCLSTAEGSFACSC